MADKDVIIKRYAIRGIDVEISAARTRLTELEALKRSLASRNGAPTRKRAMSVQAKKAVSERMRKYWAERKKSSTTKK